ncbi:hypothetical protein AB1Y20_005876 [Prymnesium parvum]|uniref:Enkurin domain-containing protein n=1 Tax=Prymnesium parvum TaxID=97485 RepID=A0AB34J0T0_PRYPA
MISVQVAPLEALQEREVSAQLKGPGPAAERMMEESIYNLIPQPVPGAEKHAMYRSKHSGTCPPTYSTFGVTGTSKPNYVNLAGETKKRQEGHHEYKKDFATMGKDGNAIPPSSLLKKKTGIGGGVVVQSEKLAKSSTEPFKYKDTNKPKVPTKAECEETLPTLPPKEPKNFITTNAVENILAVPKRTPEAVDWLKKPHFGQVPPYLQKIKKEINDEYTYIRSMQQQQQDASVIPAGMRLLPDEERLKLIDELKAKWDSVNSTYQQSSVLSLASLDTIGKVKRKEMYEAQLAQIEKDIEKLSKKFVYVHDEE